jgi:V8-like Glu-specific endopeptidase
MRRGLRAPWRGRYRPAWALSALTAPAVAVVLLSPHFPAAERLASRLATAATTLSRHAPQAPQTLVNASKFGGSFAVGALFTLAGGQLGKHFCTASVVDSKPGDLVITAAHCVTGRAPASIAFVPGYRAGDAPHGVWAVSKVIVDSQWRTRADPGHDVAFLVVHGPGTGTIQQAAGGEKLGTGWPARVKVHVVGYPDSSDAPIICQRRTRPFGKHQLKFVCGGFTGGTSGGPFLAKMSVATGDGTVIGVIGGYQQGGDLASVSYSPRFGQAVRALYKTASGEG